MSRKIVSGMAAIVLLASLFVNADITMTQLQTSQKMKNGKSEGDAKVENSTFWISSDKLRMDGSKESVLLRLDKDSMYLIDNSKKSYNGIPFSTLASGISGSSENKDAQEAMPEMFASMMKMEVSIEPTTEKKKIKDWNCTKYNQTVKMMGTSTKSELWATEDVKINPEMFKKFYSSMYLKQASMKDFAAKMAKEYEKVKGFVVYSVSNSSAMGTEMKTTSEVQEIKESSAPAGIYEVPAKYKLKKWE